MAFCRELVKVSLESDTLSERSRRPPSRDVAADGNKVISGGPTRSRRISARSLTSSYDEFNSSNFNFVATMVLESVSAHS